MTTLTKIDRIKVLLIEDNDIDAECVDRRLSANGNGGKFELARHCSIAAGLVSIRQEDFHVILLDINLPDATGIDSLRQVLGLQLDIPVIILTGLSNVTVALRCIREGAQDYLLKEEADPNRISQLIHFAIERKRGQLERRELRSALIELDAAREVQQSLYPKHVLEIPGYDLAGCWKPAACVGGDYFDYFTLDDGSLMIVCADVCGHGLGPAMLALQLRSVLRTLATAESDMVQFVIRLNKLVSADMPDHLFTTITIAKLDPASGEVEFVGAGHDAYLLNSRGRIEHTLAPQMPPLNAIQSDRRIKSGRFVMQPEQTLVFYTDGIPEAGSSNDYGVDRMLGFVQKNRNLAASELVQALIDDAAKFNGDAKLRDDMTVVVLKRDPAAQSEIR